MMTMRSEGPGGGKLSQFMSYHGLRKEDGDMFPTIMHGNSVPYHVGNDGTISSPGPDDSLFISFIELPDLVNKL